MSIISSGNGINAYVEAREPDGTITGIRERGLDYDKTGSGYSVEQRGIMRICVDVQAIDSNGLPNGRYHNEYDLGTKALAQLIQSNILDTAASITDVTDTARSIGANTACTAPTINAGTGSTAAAFTDYKLQTTSTSYTGNGSYSEAATVNAISSNTFTVTGTITNVSGSTITYGEVGMSVTANTYYFLISHDVFTGLAVSNAGTLAVTYTLTFT
jgi:hypothetical protein